MPENLDFYERYISLRSVQSNILMFMLSNQCWKFYNNLLSFFALLKKKNKNKK